MASVRAFFLVSLAFFAVLDVTVGKPKWQRQSRVIGGHDIQNNQSPYLAGIFHFDNSKVISIPIAVCSGAILSNRVILSSASCIQQYKKDLDNLFAFLGSPGKIDSSDEFGQVEIDSYVLHPRFYMNRDAFDITLIRTKQEIVFSNNIQPISLYTGDLTEDDLPVTVSGWGFLEQPVGFDFELAKTPQVLQTKTLSHDKCLSKFERVEEEDARSFVQITKMLNKNTICTSNESGHGISAHGDLGSPLVLEGKLFGVASWSGVNAEGFPDVFSKTYPHLRWIECQKEKLVNASNGDDSQEVVPECQVQ